MKDGERAMETPTYIKSLLTPTAKAPAGRKVWSIDLQAVWLPFFTATNAMGDTAIPAGALGCPLRLGYDKAGAVRFTPAGRPVVKVAKELADSVRMVKDNFTANLLAYAGNVIKEHGDQYKAIVQSATVAGESLFQTDKANLEAAIALKAAAEAEATAAAKVKAESAAAEALIKVEAEARAKAEAEATAAEAASKGKRNRRELVPA